MKNLLNLSGGLVRLLGAMLLVLASIVCFAALGQILHFVSPMEGEVRDAARLWVGIPVLLVGAGLLVCARHLQKIGKQYQMKARESALANDLRPEILFLRSFKEDESYDAWSEEMARANLFARLFFRLQTTEEQLASLLRPLGPMACIGDPREHLPKPGAYRLYYRADNEQWRTAVVDMMHKCQLVLLRAGTTRGLEWELRRLRDLVPPEKIAVLFVPRKKADYAVFEKLLDEVSGRPGVFYQEAPEQTRWQKAIASFWKPNRVIGRLAMFGPEWEPEITPLRPVGLKWFLRNHPARPLELPLWMAMAPALKKRNIELPVPARLAFWVLSISFLALLSFFYLIKIAW